jgi:putative ABC transport system permease protein
MDIRRFVRIEAIALRNAVRFRLHSLLVVLAAALGVAGILLSVGYVEGGEEMILERFRHLGTNVITLSPIQSRAVGGRARTGTIVQTLTEADYRAVRGALLNVVASSGMVSASYRLRAGDLTKRATVVGVEPAYFVIKDWAVQGGALFEDDDLRRRTRIVLLGKGVANDLFGQSDPTGERLTINRVPFVVVGVLTERGQGLDAANEDDQVYVPLTTAMHRLMNVDYLRGIQIELAAGANMPHAISVVRSAVHARHARFAPQSDDFQIQDQTGLINAQFDAFRRLSFFIRWVAVSALVVSGIGVWGLTWIGMRGRVGEIGARRAIGATRADVLVQFLSESASASALGCVAGVATGYFGNVLVDRVSGQPFVFNLIGATVSAIISFVLFLGFVSISAGRAAALNPIEALRAE